MNWRCVQVVEQQPVRSRDVGVRPAEENRSLFRHVYTWSISPKMTTVMHTKSPARMKRTIRSRNGRALWELSGPMYTKLGPTSCLANPFKMTASDIYHPAREQDHRIGLPEHGGTTSYVKLMLFLWSARDCRSAGYVTTLG